MTADATQKEKVGTKVRKMTEWKEQGCVKWHNHQMPVFHKYQPHGGFCRNARESLQSGGFISEGHGYLDQISSNVCWDISIWTKELDWATNKLALQPKQLTFNQTVLQRRHKYFIHPGAETEQVIGALLQNILHAEGVQSCAIKGQTDLLGGF